MINERYTYIKSQDAFAEGGLRDNLTRKNYDLTADNVLPLLNGLWSQVLRFNKYMDLKEDDLIRVYNIVRSVDFEDKESLQNAIRKIEGIVER